MLMLGSMGATAHTFSLALDMPVLANGTAGAGVGADWEEEAVLGGLGARLFD